MLNSCERCLSIEWQEKGNVEVSHWEESKSGEMGLWNCSMACSLGVRSMNDCVQLISEVEKEIEIECNVVTERLKQSIGKL